MYQTCLPLSHKENKDIEVLLSASLLRTSADDQEAHLSAETTAIRIRLPGLRAKFTLTLRTADTLLQHGIKAAYCNDALSILKSVGIAVFQTYLNLIRDPPAAVFIGV